MGDRYRLSIVTVVRNAPEALAATIESVRAQTYPAVEFVVVDGASTDRTVDVSYRHAARIDTWVSEPICGIYDAMNKGKALASGDFVMFVNAGDLFVGPEVIARMMSFVDDKNGLYFGKVRLVDCTGRLSWEVPIVSVVEPNHRRHFLTTSRCSTRGATTSRITMTRRWATAPTCTSPTPRVRAAAQHFTNVTMVQATLGGASSRAIMTIAELRKELANETAYARHVGATTGRRAQLVDVTGSLVVRYLASKTGGLPLVHRLIYLKHRLKSRLGG